jgi:hypothetical protein
MPCVEKHNQTNAGRRLDHRPRGGAGCGARPMRWVLMSLAAGYSATERLLPIIVTQTNAPGAAAARVKTISTRIPCPGADSTSTFALAFSRNDWTISELSLPRFGQQPSYFAG